MILAPSDVRGALKVEGREITGLQPPKFLFQYVSNKIQRYTVYLYLETALHILGGTSTHHQGHIQLYLQHLAFVTPLLLPADIVEELELDIYWNIFTMHGTFNVKSFKFGLYIDINVVSNKVFFLVMMTFIS
jgi:hypothetical protein